MKTENQKIIPVILGADLGAYSLARSFYERKGETSYLFARERLLISDGVKFTRTIALSGMDDCDVAVPALISFAKSRGGEKPLLIPLTDWYMQLTEYACDTLRGYFYFNVPSFEVWRAVSDKYSFYKLLSKFGISAPKTEKIASSDLSALDKLKPPYVLKPSDSAEYWKHKFEGMRKVYFPTDRESVIKIVTAIEASGYEGKILLQERIGTEKNEPRAAVFTTYSDRGGKVVRAVYARVLLEERGMTSRGNYAALVTEAPPPITEKIIAMLNKLGYTGFANFDILSLGNDYYCLELNTRLGRSCDHLRGAGLFAADLFCADFLGERIEKDLTSLESFWHCVPLFSVKKYARDAELLEKALLLRERGSEYTPYSKLSGVDFERKAYVLLHSLRSAHAVAKNERRSARREYEAR